MSETPLMEFCKVHDFRAEAMLATSKWPKSSTICFNSTSCQLSLCGVLLNNKWAGGGNGGGFGVAGG